MKIHVLVILTSLLTPYALAQTSPFTSSTSQQNPKTPLTTHSAELAEAEELNVQLTALYNQRKYDKALTLAKRVLKLRETALGPDHFLVGDALANLGELLYIRGLRTDAMKTYRRYFMVHDKNRNVDTRDTQNVMISALTRNICLLLRPLRTEKEDFEEAFQTTEATVQARKWF